MILGIGAALAWGIADLIAVFGIRRDGVLATLLSAQCVEVSTLFVLFMLLRPAVPADWVTIAMVLAAGGIGAVGFLAFYRGLQLGPVALVSPIVAAASAITLVLTVLVLGEHLAPAEWVGASATIGGVVLASTRKRTSAAATSAERPGTRFAVAAMLAFGSTLFVLGRASKLMGWLLPAFLWRFGLFAALLPLIVSRRALQLTPFRSSPARVSRLGVLVGLFEVIGLIAFTRGSQLGSVAVVVAASAAYPLIPTIGGFLIFHERPRIQQVVGVVAVVLGLTVMGIAQQTF